MSYSTAFKDRLLDEADRMIETKCTIRELAEWAGRPKSTVHLDITVRLEKIDKVRARKIRKILDQNYEERTIRGGYATKSCWKDDPHGMLEKVEASTKFKVKMKVE